jgi:carboxymethylenebutenolidase
MTQRVTFPAATGEVFGVLATPDTKDRVAGVVVLQEYWGINDNIKDATASWAREGFLAIAPDLYHGKLAANAGEAGKLMGALDWGKAVGEIAGAVEFLKKHAQCTGKIAVTGYCMGGALAFATACNIKGLAAVVPFYGIPGQADWTKVEAPVQAHFATHDEWASVDKAKQIQQAIEGMELHVYDAQHAFCNERRPEVYNAAACSQAWGRAVAFVRKHTA